MLHGPIQSDPISRPNPGLVTKARAGLPWRVLVGFYPDIVIEIADSARIGSIILAIKDRLGDRYDALEHRDVAEDTLIEAGYTEIEIRSWLGAITEPQGDNLGAITEPQGDNLGAITEPQGDNLDAIAELDDSDDDLDF